MNDNKRYYRCIGLFLLVSRYGSSTLQQASRVPRISPKEGVHTGGPSVSCALNLRKRPTAMIKWLLLPVLQSHGDAYLGHTGMAG